MSAAIVLLIMTFLFLFFGYMGVPVAFSLIAGVVIGSAFTLSLIHISEPTRPY